MHDWLAFMNKETVPVDRYSGMSRAAKLSAFTVTCDASVEQLEQVKKALFENYRRGGTFADFKKAVREGDLGGLGKLPSYRLENIYRTNCKEAVSMGGYLEQKEDEDIFPYFRYDAVNDSRTRASHRALNGMIFKFGTPEADLIYPPNGYQCRCTVRLMSQWEADALGGPTPTAEIRRVLAANPPDKGWEGPPFGGVSATSPSASMEFGSVRERLGEKGRDIVSDDEFVAELERMKDSPEDAGAVLKMVPESETGPADRGTEEIQRYDMSLPPPAGLEWDSEAKEIREQLGKDLVEDFKKAGMAGESATAKSVDSMLLKMMGDIYDGLWELGGKEKLMSVQEDMIRIEEILYKWKNYPSDVRSPSLDRDRYSADALKFLSLPQLLVVNFQSSGALCTHARYVLSDGYGKMPEDQKRINEKRKAKILEMYRANEIIHDALNRRVDREERTLYRGMGSYPETNTGEQLAEVLRVGKPGSTIKFRRITSFAEGTGVADRFLTMFGGSGEKVMFRVRTGKAMPMRAVAEVPELEEFNMKNGSVFRVDKVGYELIDTEEHAWTPEGEWKPVKKMVLMADVTLLDGEKESDYVFFI
ncbi:MAG: phage head morphogenesis protein [Deltaproteobacteria bacterium]|jgi:SPP1 gp7 family putative phage head morphogenesis protein|nr:phage head morphogenesis protein [Deltaproteobacteria bacterium]